MESDINDIFDSIVLSEESVCKISFDDGFKKGEESGLKEGYHFGYHRGIELGKEIGFYAGFVEEMLNKGEINSAKVNSLLAKFQSSLHHIPHENSDSVDFEFQLRNIRSLYKIVCSSLGISPVLPTKTHSLKY